MQRLIKMKTTIRSLVFVSIFLFSCTIFAKNVKKSQILDDLWPRVYFTVQRGDLLAAGTDAGLRLFKCSAKACRETDRFMTPDALSTAVFMDPKNLLIGGGMGLWSLRITSDAKLKPLWHKAAKGAIKDLVVTPKLVIAAMGATGIGIYKRQGNSLVLQRLYPTTDYCRSIALRTNILYAACGYEGLLVLDISDPARPVRKAKKNLGGPVRNVRLIKDKAYVALGRAGAAIMSIQNPLNPQVVGRVQLQDGGRATAVFGHYLYVADGMKGIGIFDITNPRRPIDKGHLNTKGAAVRLVIQKDRLIIANDYAGIAIYGLSVPVHPKLFWRTKR